MPLDDSSTSFGQTWSVCKIHRVMRIQNINSLEFSLCLAPVKKDHTCRSHRIGQHLPHHISYSDEAALQPAVFCAPLRLIRPPSKYINILYACAKLARKHTRIKYNNFIRLQIYLPFRCDNNKQGKRYLRARVQWK